MAGLKATHPLFQQLKKAQDEGYVACVFTPGGLRLRGKVLHLVPNDPWVCLNDANGWINLEAAMSCSPNYEKQKEGNIL